MREALPWVVAAAWALLACGETKQPAAESTAGTAGQVAAGGAPVAGSTSHGGQLTNAGAGQGGAAGAGGSAGAAQAGMSGAACEPVEHERPEPGALTGTFASLIEDFVGVYQIDDAYEQANGCSSMCRTGSTLGPEAFGYTHLLITSSTVERFDVFACKGVADCTNPNGGRARVGAVDGAKSDRILFSEMGYVASPQQQTCTGGTDDTWLIATAPKKIRVDVERVRVQFPPYFSDVSQLYGCDSGDALEAAHDKPCNELSVLDATLAE